MKKILLLMTAILLLSLSSCDESASNGRRIYKAYFKHILKDPGSFTVYDEKYTKDGEYTVNWKLDYGAKNSYDSMVREQVSFTTIGNSIFIDGASYDVKDFKIGFNFISQLYKMHY